jgi:hypothetical protein
MTFAYNLYRVMQMEEIIFSVLPSKMPDAKKHAVSKQQANIIQDKALCYSQQDLAKVTKDLLLNRGVDEVVVGLLAHAGLLAVAAPNVNPTSQSSPITPVQVYPDAKFHEPQQETHALDEKVNTLSLLSF